MNLEIKEAKENDSTMWAKVMVGLMLVAMSMSIVVLGAVGIVSIASNDSSSGPSVAAPTAAAIEVQVELSEFAISMVPAIVPPGNVTFRVHNAGMMAHDFALPDKNQRTASINAGESAILVVDMSKEGSFKVLCEVAGHEASGMVSEITVMAGATTDASAAPAEETAMSWQEMDAAMLAVAKLFPAKTSGIGNSILAPIMSADGYKEFRLTAKIVDWEVEPGKFVKGWTYNGEIPGPIMYANVGDKVRIVLKNDLPESTSLHMHGIRVPNAMDGVDPYTQDPIKPGDTFNYEFTALETAIGMYHSHHNAQVQIPNGLSGALIIGDWKEMAMKAAAGRTGDADGKAEQEVVMALNDAGTIGLSLNGKSFPATAPYTLKVGETMVVHYFNEGLMAHPMHLHQPSGLVVARDGMVLDSPYFADTISIGPGERWTVVYTAKDAGVWAWHCHILTHAETSTGMRYMVTALIVS